MFMVMFPILVRQRVIFTCIRYGQHVLAVNNGYRKLSSYFSLQTQMYIFCVLLLIYIFCKTVNVRINEDVVVVVVVNSFIKKHHTLQSQD